MVKAVLHDAVIVGGGPAGVSAAWPLAEAGASVLIVDAGLPGALNGLPEQKSLHTLRTEGADQDARTLDTLLGPAAPDLSPRVRLLRQPAAPHVFRAENSIRCTDFTGIGTLAAGGLSRVWGCSVAQFDDRDLDGWPISSADLRDPYERTAARIGVSGRTDDAMSAVLGTVGPLDPPLPQGDAVAGLLERYRRRPVAGLTFGAARNAVITRDRPGRAACRLDKSCVLGCPIGSVYGAHRDLDDISARANVALERGILIESVERAGDGWLVRGRARAGGAPWERRGRHVILCAGTLASTRLVLQAKGDFDRPRRLLHTPAAALAFLVPRRLGRPIAERGFGMAQAAFVLGSGPDAPYGMLYEADSFFAADLAGLQLVSRRGTAALLRSMMSGLVLGLLYFSGALSRNSATLDRSGTLFIRGGVDPDLAAQQREAFRSTRRAFASIGAFLLPGVSRPLPPGAEVHYAGTLPMGSDTSAVGEVEGMPGLFVADGSIFPSLPPKSHTLTIMANALRVGEAVARRVTASA